MKHFGQINNDPDIATKAYVDSCIDSVTGRDYNTTTTLVSLPVDKRNIIVSIPSGGKSHILSLHENLSTGGELFVYVKSLTDGINAMIPSELGGYPVSYCGYYNSSANSYLIPLSYTETKQNGVTVIIRTTVTLHIFFDGSMYYIDRFLTYNNNAEISKA